MTQVGKLPDGSRGFDCNTRVTDVTAKLMKDAGFDFAMRYVTGMRVNDYDLSTTEVMTILRAGLALGVVQHVPAPHWIPTGAGGSSSGAIAANDARSVGIPRGVTIWCDMEEVGGVVASRAIEYNNAWCDAVAAVGYDPGTYLGWHYGMTGKQAYYDLKCRRFFAGYNLNIEDFPAVRGVQIRQYAYPPVPDRVAGIPWQYDVDVVQTDDLGDSPMFLLP